MKPSNGDDPSKPRGRPKADVPKASVSAWIPTRDYDRIVKAASRREVSVSRLIGTFLKQALQKESK